MNFFFCDHDDGPCIFSEHALSKMKADPARCPAHGAIIGNIIRDCADREDARAKLGVPFKKLYLRRQP